MVMEFDVASKLFLELSQIVPAKTRREIDLERELATERETNHSRWTSMMNLATYAENPTEANWRLPMSGACIGIRDVIRRLTADSPVSR